MTDVRTTSAARVRRENDIRGMMTRVFAAHREAREAFVKRMEEGQLLNPFSLRPVLKAQGDMLPWGRVQQLTRTGTALYPAMLEVRQNCLRALLGYGEAQTSDLIATDLDRIERDGMRRFINATARFIPQNMVEVPVIRAADAGELTRTTDE